MAEPKLPLASGTRAGNSRGRWRQSLHCLWLLLSAAGCTASIKGDLPNGGPATQDGSTSTSMPTSTSTSTGGAPPAGALAAFACAAPSAPDPGPSPLRLLSRTQYLNTLSTLFTKVPNLDTELGAADTYPSAFGLVQADIDQVTLGGYQQAAEAVSSSIVADAGQLAALVPCAAGADKRGCVQTFVQKFSALAYRAPVTDPADIARHMAVYDAGAKTSHEHGVQMVLSGMLQSLRFLYRVELGTDEKVGSSAIKLSPYELAARLAYVVWDGPPDAALVSAAASGQLSTKDQLSMQLSRLLTDPKGASFLRRFLQGLSQLQAVANVVKDPTLYPQWTQNNGSLPSSMQAQASAFFDEILQNQGGKLQALFTSTTVFANKDLASFYGASAADNSFVKLTMPVGQSAGLLTLPAVLSLQAKPDQSWPIYRGRFVRESLLCYDLPAPPPNVPKPPEVQAGVSTRERLSQHETDPTCGGCHTLIDPIGFGFEAFDAVGRYRTTDGGQPVNASGKLTGTDVDGDFNGVTELGQKLAGSEQVRQCMARQWFRFAMSRYEQSMDGCTMKTIDDAVKAAGTSLSALPQALITSDAFMYRRPVN